MYISNAPGHAERFGHLRTCVEPDWQTFGTSKHTARADLIELAEWLGCRDEPCVLQRLEELCLARGAATVLAALEAIGGPDDVLGLHRANPAAAACLCHGLMQAVGDIHRRWARSDLHDRASRILECLGPDLLSAAAADLHKGAPDSWQRACAAAWLANGFVLDCLSPDERGHPARPLTPQAVAAWQVGLHISASCSVQSTAVRKLLSLYIAPCWLHLTLDFTLAAANGTSMLAAAASHCGCTGRVVS